MDRRSGFDLLIRDTAGLSPEIGFPIIRPEKGSNHPIRVESEKGSAFAVESGEDPIRPLDFEDVFVQGSVPQTLSQAKVLLAGYFSKFSPMLLIMVKEFLLAGKTDFRPGDGRGNLRGKR
jgi:hypothetical protein